MSITASPGPAASGGRQCPDGTASGKKMSAAGLASALIVSMRPRQWTKNVFVLIALVFTNNVPTALHDTHRWHMAATTGLAFLIFCIVSGAVYLLNDVADREQDHFHPAKRNRPIASGRLPWRIASAAAVLLALGGTGAAFLINARFGLVTAGYLALQIAYTFGLKHLVLIDVFAIAGGFVFRAVAGALAISVPISVWLLVCTLLLALFLGFGKRRHELVSLADDARNHRRNLEHYSVPLLDQVMSIVLGSLTVSYAVYTIMSSTGIQHPWLVATLVNVLYGIFRYLYLIQVEHMGGSPEAILLEDRPMQVNLVIWVLLVIVAFRLSH